ncbi:MAG TPA: hypothetical protein PLJ30_08985 [Deltaproteobacteria bacterium]|jgi:hypothetical protein|nr:hypothetical protein [Deltaproteobacteria bacterium]HPA84929.1 hypothetical protein [Deltaproteobacteria bacterium]HPV28739.1 hypothetical protein [Deltaproteobacteria bacterium]
MAAMYKLIEGTEKEGYARGFGLTESGAHEEVDVPVRDGRPVDRNGIPLEPDNKLITLGDTRCESFLGGTLFVVVE